MMAGNGVLESDRGALLGVVEDLSTCSSLLQLEVHLHAFLEPCSLLQNLCDFLVDVLELGWPVLFHHFTFPVLFLSPFIIFNFSGVNWILYLDNYHIFMGYILGFRG